MSDVAWERLRNVTLEQLVTHVKLNGGAAFINGKTPLEGFAFGIAVAVAVPGNEHALDELVKQDMGSGI